MGPGIKPRPPALQADSSPSEPLWKHKDLINIMKVKGSLKCHTNLSSIIKEIIFLKILFYLTDRFLNLGTLDIVNYFYACCRDHPMPCSMFKSILCLDSLDASSTQPQAITTLRQSPDIAKYLSSGQQNHPQLKIIVLE